MARAAVDYAAGRVVASAPPSLRVYILAKRYPLPLSALLEEDHLLMVELEVYRAEEDRVEAEHRAREARRSTASTGRARGLFRRRGR